MESDSGERIWNRMVCFSTGQNVFLFCVCPNGSTVAGKSYCSWKRYNPLLNLSYFTHVGGLCFSKWNKHQFYFYLFIPAPIIDPHKVLKTVGGKDSQTQNNNPDSKQFKRNKYVFSEVEVKKHVILVFWFVTLLLICGTYYWYSIPSEVNCSNSI